MSLRSGGCHEQKQECMHESDPIEKSIGWCQQEIKQIETCDQDPVLPGLDSLPEGHSHGGISADESGIKETYSENFPEYANVIDKEVATIKSRQSAVIKKGYRAQAEKMVGRQRLRDDAKGIDTR